MKLPKFLWIKGQKYYFNQVYNDEEYEELQKYCERQKKRNGTRYYIRSFDTYKEGHDEPGYDEPLYDEETPKIGTSKIRKQNQED